jgi:hypothetical protein
LRENKGPFATECTALVNQYLPQVSARVCASTRGDLCVDATRVVVQIIQWLEKNETPAQICAKLGVCNNGKHTGAVPSAIVPLVNANNVGVSAGCAICKTVVGYVEAYVQQNATQQQIETALKKICALVKPIQMICDDLVDNELPSIIARCVIVPRVVIDVDVLS